MRSSDLFHPGALCTFSPQWDPEDVNLEGSKDKVELLGSQVHQDSVRTAHLNDDD